LAYVGITRARERLYLSRAITRAAWGAPSYNPGSRFIEEVPSHLVRWEREAQAPTQWTRSEGRPAPRTGMGQTFKSTNVARRAIRSAVALEPGDRVTHDSFGLGTVLALEGVDDNAVASVDFGSAGVKRLLLRYAPLEKL
jgi:DNA helicase-2/ATP-dependent DNA helicase PcrA